MKENNCCKNITKRGEDEKKLIKNRLNRINGQIIGINNMIEEDTYLIQLKPASYFSYLRVKCDHTKCIDCKKCVNNCPMNVDMLDDSRKRKNGTECILCCNCINNCPKNALDLK